MYFSVMMCSANRRDTAVDHVRQAVTAARDIRRRCSEREAALVAEGFDPAVLGLGIGVHTGIASFGEFGRVHKDFTAIGETVNLAARLQAAARPGEVLVSGAVLDKLEGEEGGDARVLAQGLRRAGDRLPDVIARSGRSPHPFLST